MNEHELQQEFERRRPALHALGDMVVQFVLTELASELKPPMTVGKFLQIPPKPRVKEMDSFLEKVLRKEKKDPFNEINDLVGVRFVVLLLEDIDRIGAIVKRGSWHWQKDRDFESERLSNPDYFAYQSDHFVIRTTKEGVFNDTTIPVDLTCEIQIRTILQHAYAEMAHSSDYKPSVILPDDDQRRIKRALAKGSALIETTDEVFREIKKRLHDYGKSVEALLQRSSELYDLITGQSSRPDTPLSAMIVETYRDLLTTITPDDIDVWVKSIPTLGDDLEAKRRESVFFRDAIVVLLGVLISRHESIVPTRWPIDASYLEQVYTLLGIAGADYF
ncbi:MAG: RelA/SpoT protein [Schlesneria sp.]|nr:RelA/SpoT protein [Schlesneria sp.]